MWRLLWSLRQQGWHFRRQVLLGTYFVDFACIAAKLVIEVDGDTHGSDAGIATDAERDAYLAERGMLVLRFSNADVLHNGPGVFEEIARALGAVSATGNTRTQSLPARGRERVGGASSSPSPLRGGSKGGGA